MAQHDHRMVCMSAGLRLPGRGSATSESQSQRAQYPLNKEYTLHYRGFNLMILRYIP